MTCIAKGGTEKNPKLPAALGNDSSNAQERFLLCRCRENGALLQLAIYKMTAQSTLPSGYPLPKWQSTKIFSRPDELAYTESFLAKTAGLSVEQLLQPPAGRLISTINWAVKELEGILDDEENKDVIEELKASLRRIQPPA